MEYIPWFSKDSTQVFVRKDGRYGTHDFMQWPQFYFDGTWYLPYILRKPSPLELPNHKYRLIWYDLHPRDFIKEPGSISDVGMIREDLREEFVRLKWSLHNEILEFMAENSFTERSPECREMLHSDTGQRFACIALEWAPQTYLMTLLTLTSFQRHFLEALACLDYHRKWRYIELKASSKARSVDTSIMGCITPDIILAQKFFEMGVPNWLIRPISAFSRSMQIHVSATLISPKTEINMEIYPGTNMVWDGPPTAIRNRACQNLRLGNIDVGHSAWENRPGELPHHSTAGMPTVLFTKSYC